jgi:CheY-like chemotaxis protein
VIAAYDGDEGVKKALSEHPDLVILDMVMPKMNGIEALSRIKSDPRTLNIPCISSDLFGHLGVI